MGKTKRVEIYMKSGSIGLSTTGAIVRLEDWRAVASGIVTRLTGGSVAELEVDCYYVYQFNIAGEGKFALAVRTDGDILDFETRYFDSSEARRGSHGERSFAFKI